MTRQILLTATFTLLSFGLFAQEEKDNKTPFKVSGYIQSQVEIAEKDGKTKTGFLSTYDTTRDANSNMFLRYGIRRGRIKAEYSHNDWAKGVFEININEEGFKPENVYLELTPLDWLSMKAGLMTDWFGHELQYSSALLETLERCQLTQKLFPDEKDLGIMFSFIAPDYTGLKGLRLDWGFVSGNAIHKDDDGRANFLAHLKYNNHNNASFKYGVGLSYYNGTTNNIDSVFYKVTNHTWIAQNANKNHHNTREYFGIDAQFSFQNALGNTCLKGEYISGKQPSQISDLSSPNNNAYTSSFNHLREFRGGYIYLIHDIISTPLSLVLKYAFIDNNTLLKGNQVTLAADLAMQDYGFGILWKIKPYLRLTAFYDINTNEKTTSITDKYTKNLKDNIFTLRLQYSF